MYISWISKFLRQGASELVRFACVGTGGFILDTSIVYATRDLLGIYAAGIVGYIGGSVLTWMLNRSWTFRDRVTTKPSFQQWLTYLSASSAGFVLNRGAFFAAVTCSSFVSEHPVFGVAIGSVAGMLLNFTLNRAVVFRAHSPQTPHVVEGIEH
jgi:putative flippase GtrA